jgi:hypothetical protein
MQKRESLVELVRTSQLGWHLPKNSTDKLTQKYY